MQHSTQFDSLGWPQFVPPDKPCRQSIHIFKRRQKQCSPFLAGGGVAVLVGRPSLPLRLRERRRGFWTVRHPRGPALLTVVHAIDSCFRKFFLFFPGGVGGVACLLPEAVHRMPGKFFCFFCGGYAVKSCNKLRVIPLAAGP